MSNTRTLSKAAATAVCRLSVVAALAIGGIFYGGGISAPADTVTTVTAPEGDVLNKPEAIMRNMEIPLSTWVGPGDALRIKAYPDTASFISGDYTIFDGGFVMLPVLGRVQVTNMSVAGLNARLTEEYAKYTAYPNVQIEPMIHLVVSGGFLRPGVYLVNPLSTFLNALSASGGTVRDDGLRLLRWERDGKVIKADLTTAVEGTTSLWVLGFKSGDQICVTLRTKKDILPIISFITSTVVTTGTLAATLLILMK
jgi:protein involved in polysaccharide export with SLBB domain